MQEKYRNIDELFSSELNDVSVTPPEGVWEGIEQKLVNKKSRKIPLIFFKVAASIVLFLISATLGIYLFNNQAIDNKGVVSEWTPQTTSKGVVNQGVETTSVLVSKHLVKQVITQLDTSSKDNFETAFINNATPVLVFIDTISNQDTIIEQEAQLTSFDAVLIASTNTNNEIIFKKQQALKVTSYASLLSEFEDVEEYDYQEKQKDKWAIGGQAGPQYSYRQIGSKTSTQENLDLYNDSEAGLMAYAGGINIAYKPARRLSIQSGVYYSKIGQSSPALVIQSVDNIYSLIPGSEDMITSEPTLRIASSTGSIPKPDNSEAIANSTGDNLYQDVRSVNQYMEFIEVPLIARYAIIDRKINFHVLGGISTNFLIASPVYLDNGDYYSETTDLNIVNYSSTLGLGLGYTFSSKVVFSLEPQFKYYIKKINSSSQTDVHPYSLGVFTGVTYIF
jgi:hypothetical protein